MSEPTPKENVIAGEPPHHAHAAPTESTHAAAANAFSDAEWAQLQAEDFAAGRAIVLLMVGIFSTGVVIYSIVAAFVMS